MMKTNSHKNLLHNSGSEFHASPTSKKNQQPVWGSLQTTEQYLESASAVNNAQILRQYEQDLGDGGNDEFEMDDYQSPATPERKIKIDTIGVYDRRSGGTNLQQSNKHWRESPG